MIFAIKAVFALAFIGIYIAFWKVVFKTKIGEETPTAQTLQEFGSVTLSVQASATHRCQPRVNGLPLEAYTALEVCIFEGGKSVLPSTLGVGGFDHYFSRDPGEDEEELNEEGDLEDDEGPFYIAEEMPRDAVNALRGTIARKY